MVVRHNCLLSCCFYGQRSGIHRVELILIAGRDSRLSESSLWNS